MIDNKKINNANSDGDWMYQKHQDNNFFLIKLLLNFFAEFNTSK